MANYWHWCYEAKSAKRTYQTSFGNFQKSLLPFQLPRGRKKYLCVYSELQKVTRSKKFRHHLYPKKWSQPDRSFHYFRASKSVNQRIVCARKFSIYWFVYLKLHIIRSGSAVSPSKRVSLDVVCTSKKTGGKVRKKLYGRSEKATPIWVLELELELLPQKIGKCPQLRFPAKTLFIRVSSYSFIKVIGNNKVHVTDCFNSIASTQLEKMELLVAMLNSWTLVNTSLQGALKPNSFCSQKNGYFLS